MIIKIPEAANYIIEALEGAGHEAYIVGGCVRDALLDRVPGDWDITTSALPLEVKEIFKNTVDTGIKHGTVMIIRGGDGYEVTTYRVDGEYEDNRHPKEVTFTRSLSEDLKRRDFTINAFAYNPKDCQEGDLSGLVDLFGGIDDLNHGIIRCVGNPDERFDEDALRIMRAVRFSAQLGFDIEEKTKAAITTHAENLADISMERIRVEFEKTLISRNPTYVVMYKDLGLQKYIVPDFWGKCFDHEQDDLINALIGQEKSLLLAAFFIKLMPEEAEKALRYLKYDNKTRVAAVKVLQYKDQVIPAERVAVKNALNEMGLEVFCSLMAFKAAEIKAGKCNMTRTELDSLVAMKDDILETKEAWNYAGLAVNGKDLIASGIPAGTAIGAALEKALQYVILHPTMNTKEQILAYLLA